MKIFFVAGAGRSGSTLLDMALGQSLGVCSCGELSNLSTVILDDLLCSCGTPVPVCAFWKEVVAPVGPYGVNEEKDLNHPRKLAAWLGVVAGFRQKKYVEWVDSVYESVGRVAEVDVLVDSSKSPVRLAALLRYSRHKICIIHLVRDPRSVAASLSKPLKQDINAGVQHNLEPKGVLRTYGFWVVINLLVHSVALLARARYVRIKYEEFTSNPSAEIGRLIDYNDCAFDAVSIDSGHLSGGHLMAGNRLRLKKGIVIVSTETVPEHVSVNSVLGRIISWPLRRFYGYRGY